MYRNVINDLALWVEKECRQILYIKGAYGVGKTWTVKDFATAFFKHQNYIDVSESEEIKEAITAFDLEKFSAILTDKFPFDADDSTYIPNAVFIFDELQGIPDFAKFFYEFLKLDRRYNICLIASTMEFTEYEYSHQDVFNIIRMRPMSFEEYLIANKSHALIASIENQKGKPLTSVEERYAKTLLKEYLMTGGMPQVVKAFIKKHDYSTIRPIQKAILDDYDKILKKCSREAEATRVRRIWRSIPKQLVRDNKKFMYNAVEDNARAREYLDATSILCNLGFARRLPLLKAGLVPLEDHVDHKSFEFFLIDHGLLRAIYDLPVDESIPIEKILSEKNGAVAEQYIFQELFNKVGNLYYWVSKATARVPFVYEGDNSPVPVDIRFESNKKAQNIKAFCTKNPNTEISIKVSLDQVNFDNMCITIPAYALWNM